VISSSSSSQLKFINYALPIIHSQHLLHFTLLTSLSKYRSQLFLSQLLVPSTHIHYLQGTRFSPVYSVQQNMARATRSRTVPNPEYSSPLPTASNAAPAIPQVSTSPPGSPELPQSPTNLETPSPSSGQNKKQKVEETASSSSDTMAWVPTPDDNLSPLSQEDEVEAQGESSTATAGPSSVHSSSRRPPPNFRPTLNPPYLQTFIPSSEEDELQPRGDSSTFAASPHPTIGDEVQPQGESSILTTASTSITATAATSSDFSALLKDRLYLTYRFYQVDHLVSSFPYSPTML
jgi:hypothetical protein